MEITAFPIAETRISTEIAIAIDNESIPGVGCVVTDKSVMLAPHGGTNPSGGEGRVGVITGVDGDNVVLAIIPGHHPHLAICDDPVFDSCPFPNQMNARRVFATVTTDGMTSQIELTPGAHHK